MILWILAIWSLVPLPFLNPAWTSGSSQFMYWWSLPWILERASLGKYLGEGLRKLGFSLNWLSESRGNSMGIKSYLREGGNRRSTEIWLVKYPSLILTKKWRCLTFYGWHLILPNIRVFSIESALPIRWPKWPWFLFLLSAFLSLTTS